MEVPMRVQLVGCNFKLYPTQGLQNDPVAWSRLSTVGLWRRTSSTGNCASICLERKMRGRISVASHAGQFINNAGLRKSTVRLYELLVLLWDQLLRQLAIALQEVEICKVSRHGHIGQLMFQVRQWVLILLRVLVDWPYVGRESDQCSRLGREE